LKVGRDIILDYDVRTIVLHLCSSAGPDIGHEFITAPGYRRYEPVITVLFAQDPPQRRNVLGKIVLLDDGVRPDSRHQLFFVDRPAVMRNQVKKYLKSLRHQPQRLALGPVKQPLGPVQPKAVEAVNLVFPVI
jgi:hypothetical protein